jgi:peptidyl-dipeptidase Dcp
MPVATRIVFFMVLAALLSCSKPDPDSSGEEMRAKVTVESDMNTENNAENPFYSESPLYLNYPPFDKIRTEHYLPAFQRGMAQQLAEVEAIATQPADPTFDNTVLAYELTGQLLNRVSRVFFSLTRAHTNDDLRAIQQRLAPQLAAHNDTIILNQALFARFKALDARREELDLNAESLRLLDQYITDFVQAGADLNAQQQQRMRDINTQLALLTTEFSQNALSEVNDLAIIVDSREQLRGLSDKAIASAQAEAALRGLSGQYVLPLLNTSGQPALANLRNRALRERIHTTSLSRGNRGGDFDNRQILADVLRLRAQKAQLLGYANHAEYVLAEETAQTVVAVNQRLAELAQPAAANARREAEDLQKMIVAEDENFQLQSWDWDFYSEKVRAQRYQLDEKQLRPYFELNNILNNGVFFAAEKLYGITFKERNDLPVYQEDVRVFEVFDGSGTTLAIFIADFYARPSKRGGAWMNSYVSQSDLMGTQPIVANHLNIPKPAEGEVTLLSFDEVTTMFHEFGHALHGMFSNVYYPYFAGTSVPRDFLEYPSQVNEMWAIWPEVIKSYAVHYETGEPLPEELLEKVVSFRDFNQGFRTSEYLAASILDQAYHQLSPEQVPTAEKIMDFEAQTLATAGLALDAVPPRYRSTYFLHIMGGYSAGYYAYIWSEVLDADTVEWFKDNGGLNRENGDHFRRTLLSRGGSRDAMELFRDFRGRDAEIGPLLERRGLN